MTNTKLVSLTLATATLKVEGNTNEELLEAAKNAFIEQLQNGDFPQIRYGINDADSLTLDTVAEGMIVEDKENGRVGIVTKVNKKNILVAYVNHVMVSGPPQLFKSSKTPFEQARSKRPDAYKEVGMWDEGYSGYIESKNGIQEVIVGRTLRGKVKLHIVNTTRYIAIPEESLNKYLKDEKDELIVN